MANAERDYIVEKVKEVLAAPSCCQELKAAGGKICFCPACTAGQAILDKKDILL